MLRKTVQILLLTLLLTLVSFGQSADEAVSEPNAKTATKLDEFGRTNECDAGGRLDSFFANLQNNPTASGYIIIYQAKDVLPADFKTSSRERFIRNQIAFRNQDASRIIIVRGGFREELATELWIVPNGAEPPVPTDTVAAPTMPRDKTFLYDSNNLTSDESYGSLDDFILPSVKAKIEEENNIADEESEEESKTEKPLSEAETEGFNPIEAEIKEVSRIDAENEKLRLELLEKSKFDWVNEKFGEVINRRKGSSGVMIFYADDTYYDISKLQAHIEEGKQKIVEANKISAKRIQVVYGGYRSETQTEFWIIPKKGENPMPTAEERIIEKIEN